MRRIIEMTFFLLALTLSTAISKAQPTDTTVIVTYIANEGVLLSAGDQQVLIDAIHKPYYANYLPTPPDIFAGMLKGHKPFDSVDFVLVSHIHRDHFHAGSVQEFLQKRMEVILFTTRQAADSIAAEPRVDMVAEQVKRASYEAGVKSEFSYKGIAVKLLKIAHGSERNSWIQNAGHLITLGGKTFLHIGDPSFGEDDFEQLNLAAENIDVAILPFWFLNSEKGREVIAEYIQPQKLIAVHVSPGVGPKITKEIHRFYPDAVVFTEPLQEAIFD